MSIINIPEWKMEVILNMKKKIEKRKKRLIFIHIPKCAGSYAAQYINQLDIINKGHHQASLFDKFSFAIIRHPVDRFESLLNYRLKEQHPRPDWPHRLIPLHYDKSKTLNEIITQMTDYEIISFYPYQTLKYWTRNIKLLVTIEEFIPTLKLLGYNIEKEYSPINISDKNRGTISPENRNRIEKIYKDDMNIFYYWTRSSI